MCPVFLSFNPFNTLSPFTKIAIIRIQRGKNGSALIINVRGLSRNSARGHSVLFQKVLLHCFGNYVG